MEEKQRILVVDDEPQLTRVLRRGLTTQGYEVRIAGDGEFALQTFHDWPAALVITDLAMPNMSGLELCRRLRKVSAVPIIVLSVRGEETTKVEALDAGADDYITKPFSIRELLARAKAFLRRRQSAAESVLEFGLCKLDFVARKLFRGREEIALTAKEFRLLEFFARRPGRALTRNQILDAVWGNDIMVNDRSVDRCVTTLRAKIEREPHHPRCLQTIRDVGYRFELVAANSR